MYKTYYYVRETTKTKYYEFHYIVACNMQICQISIDDFKLDFNVFVDLEKAKEVRDLAIDSALERFSNSIRERLSYDICSIDIETTLIDERKMSKYVKTC